jgi:hypothetical protein
VVLELGGFAGTALATEAERHSLTCEEVVSLAAEYYADDVGSPRMAHHVPTALGELDASERFRLEIELRAEIWALLEERALEEDTTLERLLEHATLQLIADLDSGRVKARVASP